MLETMDVIKSSDVILQCEFSGTSPFEVTWYKDKRQIRGSKKYKITYENHVASLYILKVESPDIGEYMCMVKNDVGSINCTGTLNLKGQYIFHVLYLNFAIPVLGNNFWKFMLHT